MKKIVAVVIVLFSVVLWGCGNGSSKEETGSRSESVSGREKTDLQNGSGSEPETEASGHTDDGRAEEETAAIQNESSFEEESHADPDHVPEKAVQGGACGEISVLLPDGWIYEKCPADSGQLIAGTYGIHFYPEEAQEGYIELAYEDFFGVCGTGLKTEETTIAGNTAKIGTYDDHEYWNFIIFEGEKEGIIAVTYLPESWWEEYGDQALEILDTVSFDQSAKE